MNRCDECGALLHSRCSRGPCRCSYCRDHPWADRPVPVSMAERTALSRKLNFGG